jgi:hypothetical protein
MNIRTAHHVTRPDHRFAFCRVNTLAFTTTLALVVTSVFAGADGPDDRRPSNADDGPPPIPVITEVYFNVVKGEQGDASADGSRHATGDEFVELWNPSSETINLEGWSLVSRLAYHADDPAAKRGVRFTFPDFELEPGYVAVVFNGEGTRVPGPVGSPRKPHKKPNDTFHDAFVFTMRMGSKNRSFANGGDFVLLLDAEGQPVEGVAWGDPDPAPPRTHATDEHGDEVRLYTLHIVDKRPGGSVHRVLDDEGDFHPFANHEAFGDDTLFSPGRVLEDMDRPGDDDPDAG